MGSFIQGGRRTPHDGNIEGKLATDPTAAWRPAGTHAETDVCVAWAVEVLESTRRPTLRSHDAARRATETGESACGRDDPT